MTQQISSKLIIGVPGSYTAPAGSLGEYLTSTVASGSAVALTTATAANVTSKTIEAGTYWVWSQTNFILTAATATLFQSGVSIVSATLPPQAGGSGLGTDAGVSVPLITTLLSATYSQSSKPTRLQVSKTTIVYLVASSTFSAGSSSAYGTLEIERFI